MPPRQSSNAFERPAVRCVILAAGDSRRFGRGENKLLADFRGRPLLQHAVDAACASTALACALVLGADAELVEARIETRRCAVLRNEGWQEGIASSIRCALAYRAHEEATILLVGDEPFVTSADIDSLIAENAANPTAIVALRAARVWGTPTLFPRSDYAALAKLHGDHGAKSYAKTQVRRLRTITASNVHAFTDIDTKADWRKALRTR